MCKPQIDSKYKDDDVDDEAMLTKACCTNASYSSLEDSDSYSFSLKIVKWRQSNIFRIPGLMFLLVLCGRQSTFGISNDCSYHGMHARHA